MKIFKVLALVLVLVMSMTFFAACGQKADQTATTAGTTAAATTAAQTTAAADKYLDDSKLLAGKPYAGASLKFICCCDTVNQFARIIERGKTEFLDKTGITVTWDAQPWDSFQQKLMTEAVSGSGTYDMGAWMDAWGPALKNYLEPLDEYIAKDGIDMSDYPAGFVEASKAGSDKIMGLPFRGHFQVLYYRTDIFKKLNLEAPKTWDDVVADAKAIEKSEGIKGLSMNYGVSAGQNLMDWYTFLWGNGGDIFDANYKPIFNNDAGLAATQKYVGLLTTDKVVPTGSIQYTEADAKTDFAQGKTAMFINWSWLYTTFLDAKSCAANVINNVGTATVPLFANQTAPVTYSNVWPLGMFASSKNKDAAWEYIKWVGSAALDKDVYLNNGDIVVVHNSNLKDPEVNAKTNGMQLLGLDILKTAKALPMIPEWAEVQSVLEVGINNAASGKPVKEQMDKAAKDIEAIMQRAGYYK